MRDRPVATEKIAVFTAVRLGWRSGADKRRAIVRRRRGTVRGFCVMANIASQIKRNQRSLRERAENRQYTSAVKTYFRRLQAAVAEGDDEARRRRAPPPGAADRQGRQARRAAPQQRRAQEVPRRAAAQGPAKPTSVLARRSIRAIRPSRIVYVCVTSRVVDQLARERADRLVDRDRDASVAVLLRCSVGSTRPSIAGELARPVVAHRVVAVQAPALPGVRPVDVRVAGARSPPRCPWALKEA